MNTKQFIRKYFKPVQGRQILVFAIIIVYVINNLFGPLIISFLIDNVINGKEITSPFFIWFANVLGSVEYIREHLWIGALALVATSLFLCLAMFFRGRLNSSIAETACERIRTDLYNHMQLLPFSYQTRSNSGDLIQRCTSDVDNVRRFLGGRIGEMFYAVVMAIIAAMIMFRINASLAIYVVAFIPAIFVMSSFFFKRVQHFFNEYDEAESRLTTMAQENLSNLRVVRAFNRENYEIDKFEKVNKELSGIDLAWILELARQWGTGDFMTLLPLLCIIIAGIYKVIAGELTIGNFSVFITYTGMILWPIRQLARIVADLGKTKVSIERLCEIFSEPIEDLETGVTFDPHQDIVFEDVCFKYDDGTVPVLYDINLKIKAGETVAIMGPTGSGKSTLVHLLTRLYDYNSGSLRIGDVEVKDMQKKFLRQNVGIVLQEPFLFSKTILDNIRIARQDAEKTKVYSAAKIASVHDVINDFNAGYDTLVGEKGVTLSGGQKQRIAIARTILNGSQILVFDDSLSAVDTETDASIRNAIRSLSKGCTTIIIAHRVSSAQDADHIVVMEEGRITQYGTHQQLLEQEGLYRRIYEIQTAIEEVK
ncbi:MAG: ABC transporter ATP-binding protein [Erysipelotrichaceae bacterium]|nr:ABC transporter ATP-binding protein [Erysipelotrichaceae bacterium]